MWRRRGIGVDLDGDGLPDIRVGRFGVTPDIGMAYMGGYRPYPPAMGYGTPGVGVDLDGDGITDVRVGPYGQVRPDVGMFVPRPYYAPYPYYYPYY